MKASAVCSEDSDTSESFVSSMCGESVETWKVSEEEEWEPTDAVVKAAKEEDERLAAAKAAEEEAERLAATKAAEEV